MAQRQHDGPNHRDQEHHPRDLEVMDVLGIEHEAERSVLLTLAGIAP